MEEFPTNTKSARVDPPKTRQREEKKVARVTQTEAKRRKKPLGRRFAETFLGLDARTAWSDVFATVLVPAAKDMLADSVTQGFERMIFGESRHRSRRPSYGRIIGSPNGYTNYSSRYGQSSIVGRADGREITRKARASHDFDEIILETRVEGEEVLDHLFELVSKYEVATVADLYELAGITANYTDAKWGWRDLRGATVSRVRDGYLLDLPRPEALD